MKYVGTGHADTSKLYVLFSFLFFHRRNGDDLARLEPPLTLALLCYFSEWLSNIHRDSIASYIGHAPMLSYFSVALNQSAGRTRYNLLQKMLQPVGPAPPPEDETAQPDDMVE